jgi:pyruvate/2-oxoglutarate dehydrogenase complex dihydrolipoamide acyltransferase (E2) component
MYEFKLPDIGEGLSEAELLEWTVQVGQQVAEGEELAQISTDKVNVDLPSPTSGVIMELCCEPGEVVPVGTVIVRIDDGKEAGADPVQARPEGGHQTETRSEDQTPNSSTPVRAAPIVRRYAAQNNVDLSQLHGSGPGGQIMRQDVDDFLENPGTSVDVPQSADRLKLSGARLAAARRLAQASNTMATTTLSFEVISDAIIKRCQALSKPKIKVTPLAVVARCLSRALASHPHFNATINDQNNELVFNPAVHLGLAVDTEDGLMVPVLDSVADLDEIQITERVTDLATRARSGELSLNEMQGSTFTLSSTGGLEKATLTGTTPIVNLPNVATLWVSRINQRPRVIDGALDVGPMMACSLSFDHRYLHGADGIAFINDLDHLLNHPESA